MDSTSGLSVPTSEATIAIPPVLVPGTSVVATVLGTSKAGTSNAGTSNAVTSGSGASITTTNAVFFPPAASLLQMVYHLGLAGS